jgi:predicted phosphodiesterase
MPLSSPVHRKGMDAKDRICFVGDTHGERDRMEVIVSEAARRGARTIIQVGDFGIWPQMRHSRPQTDGFEVDVATMLERYGVNLLLFIDGNHDWHPWLRARRRKHEALFAENGPADAGSTLIQRTVLVEETGRVRWVPRGSLLELAGLRILCCGGAPSIDPELRVPGQSWWPEEEITDDEVARSCAAGRVDVLVTHDVSELVAIPGIVDRWAPGEASRHRIEQIRAATRPRWAFSGHYHKRLSTLVDDGQSRTRWELLGCESSPLVEHMVVVDVAMLKEAPTPGELRSVA